MRSLANLTGWRAVLVAIVLAALLGYQSWDETPRYRTVDSGTWEVAAGTWIGYKFSTKDEGKLRFAI